MSKEGGKIILKELIISIVIIIVIVIGNIFTGNFIDSKLEHIVSLLNEVNPVLEAEEYDKARDKISEIRDYFNESEAVLSCYVEHDELEKVKSSLVLLESYIKMESDEAFSEANQMEFVIKHIEEKDDMKIKNIF